MTAPWLALNPVAFDVETSGKKPEYALQPWRMKKGDAWLTSASAVRFDGQRLVPVISDLFPLPGLLRWFLQEAARNEWTVVGWNLAFDISCLIAQGLTEEVFRVKWLDVMLLWRHLEVEPEYEFQGARHKKRSWALKPGGVQQWIPDFAGLDEDVDFHATDLESLLRLQLYNDRDNVRAWTIGSLIWPKLTPAQQNCALIEASCLPQVGEANCHGLAIDWLTCRHLGAKLQNEANQKLRELAPHGVSEKLVRSPKQLGDLLFDAWELPVLKMNKGKTGETRSTDKEVLHELAFLDPRARGVREYREALNGKGKFSDSVLESVEYNEDGCYSHPLHNIFSTYSGRMTVSSKQGRGAEERPIGFALHQMKRGEEFREPIVAPEGFTIVEFDAAGQEFRWMACASGDPMMMQLCMPGEDAHSFMGAAITGKDYRELIRLNGLKDPVAKQDRYLGKFGNLSCQYRIGDKKLRVKARVDYEIPLELPEASRINNTFKLKYNRVPIYWEDQITRVRSLGYVETLGGRRVQVKGDWDGQWGWSMGSTAINYRIQGTGACQKYLALRVVKDFVRSIGGRLYFELHDGLYFLIPDEKVQMAVDKMKVLLDNLPYRQAWGYTPPIPMPWDCKVGKVWGTGLKEVKFA